MYILLLGQKYQLVGKLSKIKWFGVQFWQNDGITQVLESIGTQSDKIGS